MPTISIKQFGGIAPRFAKRKLNPSYAQQALNCDLWSGEVRCLRDNFVANAPSKKGLIQSIFKLDDLYLHWNEDVDVVRAPLSTSDKDRIYYSGHYNVKSTNVELAQDGVGSDYPLSWYRLGLPSPDGVITPTPDASGVGADDSRIYVYTFVTTWGEEGPPSEASELITGKVDDTWSLTGMDVSPLNAGIITDISVESGKSVFTCSENHSLETGDYIFLSDIVSTGGIANTFNDVGALQVTRISAIKFSIELTSFGQYTSGGTWVRESKVQTQGMKKRIYRTVLGKFRFVAEIDAAETDYNDTVDDTLLGEELLTTEWIGPPSDLKGLISLPNGVLAGFKNNTVYLSEPFVPHAFPTAYEQKFSYEVVGIASIGSTIVVATKGNPYLLTGTDPAFMTPSELDLFQACVSKRSVVSIKNGAMYASPDGIVYVSSNAAPRIISRDWLKEVDWRDYNPSSLNAVIYDDRYYGFFDRGLDEDGRATRQGAIVFDPSEAESTFTTLSLYSTAAYNHLEDDSLYLLSGSNIVSFSKGGGFGSCHWKSKMFITGDLTTMHAAQVKFTLDGVNAADREDSALAALSAVDTKGGIFSGAFGGFHVGQYAVGSGPYIDAIKNIKGDISSATFRLYVSGKLFFEKKLRDNRAFRLPGGYNADEYEIELSGKAVRFHEVAIAETISDLQKV